MIIYLDVVMGFNFLVDFLLLLGADRMGGGPGGLGRPALAAALGAAYSGACLLPGFSFLGNPLWRMVCLGSMGVLAFGVGRSALGRTGVFFLLSMALGGLALSFGRGNLPALVLAGLGLWCVSGVCVSNARDYVPVALSYGGKTVHVTALRDSGNCLRDPVSGEPVLVLSPEAAGELTGLTREQLRSPLETLKDLPIPGLRLIPYRAVGTSQGFLLGLRFPEATVARRPRSLIAAFAPEGLGGNEGFDALTGGCL